MSWAWTSRPYRTRTIPGASRPYTTRPPVLYVRGRLPVVDEKAAIAVVGTRRASPYGLKMAARMGYEITRCGGLVDLRASPRAWTSRRLRAR